MIFLVKFGNGILRNFCFNNWHIDSYVWCLIVRTLTLTTDYNILRILNTYCCVMFCPVCRSLSNIVSNNLCNILIYPHQPSSKKRCPWCVQSSWSAALFCLEKGSLVKSMSNFQGTMWCGNANSLFKVRNLIPISLPFFKKFIWTFFNSNNSIMYFINKTDLPYLTNLLLQYKVYPINSYLSV